MHEQRELADLLPALDRVVESAETVDEALNSLVELAKHEIPGADEVSMTLVENDQGMTVASTGQLATDLDERQYETGWGPCLDAGVSGETLVIRDVHTDDRWPEYLPKAREAGLGSSMSVPMPLRPDVGGALNVYSRTADAFDEAAEQFGRTFAAVAALVISQARRYSTVAQQARTLQEAMRSRAVIEQAKGILMAVRRIDGDEAFADLVRASQRSHVKLRDVAAKIVSDASGHAVELEGI